MRSDEPAKEQRTKAKKLLRASQQAADPDESSDLIRAAFAEIGGSVVRVRCGKNRLKIGL